MAILVNKRKGLLVQVQSQMVPSDRVEAKIPTQEEPVVHRRYTRVSHPPERFVPGLDYVMLMDRGDLSCYKDAMSRDDKLKREQAQQLWKWILSDLGASSFTTR